MICFGILRIFGEKSQKSKNWKSRQIGLLRRNVGNPRRGVHLRQGLGCLAAVTPRCQNGTPRVRHDVALLHRGEGLSRSVAVLCSSVDTVHNKQIFGLLFRKSSIRTLIV